MAMTETYVEAKPREAKTKNAARRVRAQGGVPAVVYGAGKNAVSITVDPKQISRILHSEAGHNTIFDLQLDGEKTKVMIVDWQYEPIRGALMHIDLKRIAMDKRLKVAVPIVLKGEAYGVKTEGGILEQVLREVEIECLPADIPGNITVDVSELKFGETVRVKDLPHGEGKLKFLTDEDQTVAHVVAVKEVVEPTPEAAAADAAAAPAEPEVIKKGKQETAEGEGAAAEPAKAEKKEKK
jgi:large subunit ribosomal protein L25